MFGYGILCTVLVICLIVWPVQSVRTTQNMIRPAAAAFTVTVGHPNPKKGW